jgi:phospholipid transport system substrate-binding protein
MVKNKWFLIISAGIFVLLIFGHVVYGDEKAKNAANEQPGDKSGSCVKDANDPNELWWSRWDAVVKDTNNPNEILEAKWSAVLTVIQNNELDQNLKKKIIDKISSPIFDAELMAKLALGRTHWSKLTDSEHKRFTELFTGRLKNFYLEKTTLYKNEKALFKPAIQEKKYIYVPMVFISADKEVSILYKLHNRDKGWKIFDMEVEGISILRTYQSQFDDILSKGTIHDLFAELEKPPAP